MRLDDHRTIGAAQSNGMVILLYFLERQPADQNLFGPLQDITDPCRGCAFVTRHSSPFVQGQSARDACTAASSRSRLSPAESPDILGFTSSLHSPHGQLMRLSENVRQIEPSGTIAIAALCRELRAKGRDVIDLGVGEPDFRTPDFI